MEAGGHGRWLERLLSELEIELWIGDAAEIRTRRVRDVTPERMRRSLSLLSTGEKSRLHSLTGPVNSQKV
jgi:hypothetical protein